MNLSTRRAIETVRSLHRWLPVWLPREGPDGKARRKAGHCKRGLDPGAWHPKWESSVCTLRAVAEPTSEGDTVSRLPSDEAAVDQSSPAAATPEPEQPNFASGEDEVRRSAPSGGSDAAPDTTYLPGLLRIESVRIRNFRGLGDCVLALQPDLTLLVGRNSAGKSRVLRAIALACGATSASTDDFTVGSAIDPTIDLVLAPADTRVEADFDDRVLAVFGEQVQLTSVSGVPRIAWRTAIQKSVEGWGGRTSTRFLRFDVPTRAWILPEHAQQPNRDQRGMITADLVETGRDLAAELTRPGSAIRRVLDELDVDEASKEALEASLQHLGNQIVEQSRTLGFVKARLEQLSQNIGGIGNPDVQALPARLEELMRAVEISLDTGDGGLPMRLHGSGARSLSSLQVQSVLYERKLGRDGSDTPTHPVTLLEEPESHLHPQACFELQRLLVSIPGQVIASTHSSHLVTVVPTESLRLVRTVLGDTVVRDLNPVDSAQSTPAALRMDVAKVEWEKLKRGVERPFGEVLFAHAIVVGDGASERAFLPPLLRHALGEAAAGICVVDPSSMSQATPVVKYAEAAGIPCVLFSDCDRAGRDAASPSQLSPNGCGSRAIKL